MCPREKQLYISEHQPNPDTQFTKASAKENPCKTTLKAKPSAVAWANAWRGPGQPAATWNPPRLLASERVDPRRLNQVYLGTGLCALHQASDINPRQ